MSLRQKVMVIAMGSSVTAYVYALERLERNGKWKIRGVEALSEATPVPTDITRYKGPLVEAQGGTFDDASREAMRRFYTDPACRPYVPYAIRAAGA